ncbi:unnamed protein product [Lepidochelys kempii]
MASTSRPNEALWQEISQGLAAAGYSHNVAQCRSKWKALKQAVYSECHSPRVPPHYRTMKKIWKAGGRPVFGERCLPGHVIHTRPPSALGQSTKSEPVSRFKWTWDSPSLLDLNCCVALLCAVKQLLRSTPEVAALQWWQLPWTRHPRCRLLPLLFPFSLQTPGPRSLPSPPLTPPPAFAAFPPMKQESADREADSPVACQAPAGQGAGERVLPVTVGDQGSPETRAGGEHPLLGDQALATDLQGPSVVSLLQSMQQLLVQILRTSQQVLLESLASDTLSHLISENVVQVGKTLHELLLQAHARSADLPTPLSHYAPLPPVPRSPCSPNPPPNSHDHKEEPVVSSASGFHPHQLPPPPRAPAETWCT